MPASLDQKPQPLTVGWKLCTFILEHGTPDRNGVVTATELWHAYRAWCSKTRAAPLALPAFLDEFDGIAEPVGLTRVQQGGHVVYVGLQLRGDHALA